MIATWTTMHPQALCAIRGAANLKRWGWFATRRYLERNNTPLRLMVLARQLQTATINGF